MLLSGDKALFGRVDANGSPDKNIIVKLYSFYILKYLCLFKYKSLKHYKKIKFKIYTLINKNNC